jgi:hypothetical protein
MLSPKASKAYVAALVSLLSSAKLSAPDGFTTVEILTIAIATIVAFQATYWTTNSKGEPDGDIDVIQQEDGKKTFSLNLNSDPNDLDKKNQIVFKVNK